MSHQPIVVARKPISEKSITENVLRWGTGGLNIEDSRIPIDTELDDSRLGGKGSWKTDKAAKNVYDGGFKGDDISSSESGRFPSNFIHDGSDEVVNTFDSQFGTTKSTGGHSTGGMGKHGIYGKYSLDKHGDNVGGLNDEGSVSRYFKTIHQTESDFIIGDEKDKTNMKNIKLYQGDNYEILKELPDNSVDSIVTDPPYGLGEEPDINKVMKDWIEQGYHEVKGKGFMGKDWDAFVPQPRLWKECLRVLKPGGHLLSFAGTRTYDWVVMGLRFAGFEIRDQIMWVYGSGFPKSLNIGKQVDKIQGNEREELGRVKRTGKSAGTYGEFEGNNMESKGNSQWEGWGTGLKPAHEPIVMARKPISEKSITENVLTHGTGGLNIDESRIEHDVPERKTDRQKDQGGTWNKDTTPGLRNNPTNTASPDQRGRFPANFIHDGSDEVTENFPITSSGKVKKGGYKGEHSAQIYGKYAHNQIDENTVVGDTGSAARFFYCPKASKSDREEGLEDFLPQKQDESRKEGNPGGDNPRNRGVNERKNHHPTVKPTELMKYLVKLVTPPNGTVLDPYMGSGSTGKAVKQLGGFKFIGMEMEDDYFELAEARIERAVKDGETYIEPKQKEKISEFFDI